MMSGKPKTPEEVFDSEIFSMMQEELASRHDEDYVLNPPQYNKFVAVTRFFFKKACELDGEIVPNELKPSMVNGDAIAKFQYFEASGDDLNKMLEILSYCSAVSFVVSDDDQVRISCTVPKVFIRSAE